MSLPTFKREFIQLALDCNALSFGQFTLKSGRKSPYFFNAGTFCSGSALRHMGQAYASLLLDNNIEFQHLFGPAYKGIPLATSTAIALSEKGIDVTVTSNRKEYKDHGESGDLIGSTLSGKTVILDDVITAGTAFREAEQFIQRHGGQLSAAVVCLDRCERGLAGNSAIADIQAKGIPVYSIITLFDLVAYLKENGQESKANRVLNYHAQYGVNATL